MIILHVSDFSFNQAWFDWLRWDAPAHDVAVLSGGLLNAASSTPRANQIERVSAWLNSYPRPLCVCSGRQDLEWESSANRWRPAYWLRQLTNPLVTVDGGTWNLGELSVNSFGFATHPKGGPADVWVSHIPPSGTAVGRDIGGLDCGDVHLRAMVDRYAPRLVLCGHVATPERWREQIGTTLLLNPGRQANASIPNYILVETESLHSRFYSASHDGVHLEISSSALVEPIAVTA